MKPTATGPRRAPLGRSLTIAVISVVAAAVGLVACDAPAPSVAAPTPTRVPEPTIVEKTYQIDTDVWYEGLVLHMDLATARLDARGGTIDIAFRIENPTAEASELDARMLLIIAGNRVEPTSESHIPSTPAGETTLALLTFELQEIASADDAVLEIGADPYHVARVPFGPEGGEAVTYQPIDVRLTGTTAAGDLRIVLRRGLLRWDLPDWSEQLAADLRVLTLTYDATYTGGFTGGLAFTGDNVSLRLPDGTVVQARRDGHSQSVELIEPGATKRSLFSRFEIPADATGKFGLVVRSGGDERTIPFTIEG